LPNSHTLPWGHTVGYCQRLNITTQIWMPHLQWDPGELKTVWRRMTWIIKHMDQVTAKLTIKLFINEQRCLRERFERGM